MISANTLSQGKPTKRTLFLALKILIWISFLYISTFFNLQNIYFIVSGIVYIFMNLGKRKPGDMSAYSVFNKGFKKAAGSLDASQMLMGHAKKSNQGRIFGEQEQQMAIRVDEYFKNESKYGNKPCYCQSGLKFKKCCLIQKRNQVKNKGKERKQI